MEKAKALPVIDDWLKTNNSKLTEIREQNPELYGAMYSALNYLNNYLGATKTLEPEIATKTEPQKLTTPTNILELNWIKINKFTGIVNDLLDTYENYVISRGKYTFNSYLSDLIMFFGTSYWIRPLDDDYKQARKLLKIPKSEPAYPIYRYVIEPKYLSYFKNFKIKLEATLILNLTQEIGLCWIANNEKQFYEYLMIYLKDDLLFNTLSIPDIIKGKIIPTQQEAEFEDLADELDNLEI